MRILAIERPVQGATGDKSTPRLAAAEARRAWELHQAGPSREFNFRTDELTAVVMPESGDVEEAPRILGELAA